ncbi:MAG TPA: TRAP transporter large permease [Steroidobacteraceae bacterium]|jgi:C4-dicarboxylate transporter, DctM subunit|nr:TRAP transporter large permease [Steroidobacteraceae bacterium]
MIGSPLIGLIGVLALLIVLTVGVPIGVALGLVGMAGMTLLLGLEPALIKSSVILFDTLSRYELGVLPLFLLMAHLCFAANASRDFFDAAARMIGHRRGGLALASIGGCAGFGTISGSSLATAATIGLVALPEMRKRGYSDELATGAVAAGGTLGQMVPPSGALIVFGIIAEQSIGRLFTAAIVPAITQVLLYCLVIVILCHFKPNIAPATGRATWTERRRALLRIVDIGLLVLVVIGGIALGWFTPPEAGSVGALGALVLCAWRRRLNWSSLGHAIRQTLRTSGMIYVVIIGALIFSVFISLTGIAEQVSVLLASVSGNRIVSLLVMAVLLLLLGSVLDGLALMLLTTPILLPIIQQMGLSPIWFGIFLVRAMEIGFVHPPIGMNLFVIHGIAKDVSIGRIFRGVVPFLIADFVHLLLLIFVPALVLALPKALGQ